MVIDARHGADGETRVAAAHLGPALDQHHPELAAGWSSTATATRGSGARRRAAAAACPGTGPSPAGTWPAHGSPRARPRYCPHVPQALVRVETVRQPPVHRFPQVAVCAVVAFSRSSVSSVTQPFARLIRERGMTTVPLGGEAVHAGEGEDLAVSLVPAADHDAEFAAFMLTASLPTGPSGVAAGAATSTERRSWCSKRWLRMLPRLATCPRPRPARVRTAGAGEPAHRTPGGCDGVRC